LDCGLPREALAAGRSGTDAAAIGQRYLEPIAALQDDDLVLPEAAHFSYYAVYNAFERYGGGRARSTQANETRRSGTWNYSVPIGKERFF
jgi:hypothetical protein